MRRGIAWPMVTLLILEPDVLIDVVVQPCEVGIVHVAPVNPFEHMHEQTPCKSMFVPPLAQVNCASQSEMSGCAVLLAADLSMTRSLTGTTIAAAIITSNMISNAKQVQNGNPQQRRFFFFSDPVSESTVGSVGTGGPRKDLRPKGQAVDALL